MGMKRYIGFIVCVLFTCSLLAVTDDNPYEFKGTTAIYSKEYIASVGNPEDLKIAYAAGIEILEKVKSQAEKYDDLTLEQKKRLYVELNSSIDAFSKKEELGSGDMVLFSCIAEFRNLLTLDLIKNSIGHDFLITEFKNSEIDIQKLQEILSREFSYSSENKTLGQMIKEICGFNKTLGTIDDYLSAEMFNKNFFSLISHKDLKGFIYKYSETLISAAIAKLTIIMNSNSGKKIKMGEKYSLFYENMNLSQRQLSGISTPKYISGDVMRNATSLLNSTIRNVNSLSDNERHDIRAALLWKLSDNQNPQ
jgi:hypothetical protein